MDLLSPRLKVRILSGMPNKQLLNMTPGKKIISALEYYGPMTKAELVLATGLKKDIVGGGLLGLLQQRKVLYEKFYFSLEKT